MEALDLGKIVSEYGFPIIATFGMGYFIFFIWKWVTNEIDVVIGEAMGTLIKLVDRVRMLDNDLIRLNSKLSMVLEYRAKLNPQRQDELQRLVDEYKHSQDQFNSTGKDKKKM
jgi:hypothetical protein